MHDFELYGASLFETFLAKSGRFWHLQDHFKRLNTSAIACGFVPVSPKAFCDAIHKVTDPQKDQILRLTLLQKGGTWSSKPKIQNLVCLARDTRSLIPPENGVALALSDLRVGSYDSMRLHKTGSRLVYQLLYQSAQTCGASDSLVVDSQDFVLETCNSNIIWYQDAQWFTPHEDRGLLPGIYRKWLLEEGFLQKGHLQLADLKHVEAVLICNSVRGLQPVSQIGSYFFSSTLAKRFPALEITRSYDPLDSAFNLN